jgi:hypothetical protein
VIASGSPIDARSAMTGPVFGLFVTTWVGGTDQTSIDLIDTADGTRTTIASGDSISLGAIDPGGAYAYWTTVEGKQMGLWRRTVSGGPAEKVLAGDDVAGPYINFSLDGKYMVSAGWHGNTGGWDYTVFDAQLKPVGQLLDGRYGVVVGFLDDDRLVVYPPSSDEMLSPVPLWALNIHDWSAERIASIDVEARAKIIPAAGGTPRLVFEGHDDQNRYTLSVLDPGGSARVLFVGEAPWDDSANLVVLPGGIESVEAPGWVAVFPQGRAMTATALNGGDQGARRLLRISDGEVAQAPSLFLNP